MPIYEYKCRGTGHIIDHIHRFSDGERPQTIRCEAHEADADHILSLPAIGVVAGSANPVRASKEWTDDERAAKQRGPDLGSFDYRCEPCAKTFTEIVDFRNGETSEAPRPCPACGASSAMMLTAPRGSALANDYPRWSDTLGRMVDSHSDYQRGLAERGLRIEEDGEFESWNSARTQEAERQDKVYAEYVDQLENDPAYANYRKARDRGTFDTSPEELARMNATLTLPTHPHGA